MKIVLLASFLVLCTASTVYRNRNITIGEDGNVVVTSPTGKRVVISRELGPNGQKQIEIAVSGPNIPTKTIRVNDNTLEDSEYSRGGYPYSSLDGVSEDYRIKRGSSKSQSDILAEILREYQGVVNEAQYEKLLSKINKSVKKGEISPQVYDLLEGLDQQGVYGQGQQYYGQGQQYYGQGQQYYGQGQQYYGQQGLYGQEGLYGRQGVYGQGLYGRQGVYGQGQQGIYGQDVYGQGYGYNTRYVREIPSREIQGQYYGSSRYANPLLERAYQGQGYLYGSRYGQTVPQGVYGRYSPVLRQLLGYSQTPYQGQGYERQIEQVDQVIEQLNEVEQQLEQQKQYGEAARIQENIEELEEIQRENIEQYRGLGQPESQWLQRYPSGEYYGQYYGQYRVPLGWRQLIGNYLGGGRTGGYSYSRQPIYGGYQRTGYPFQSRIGSYYNTVPQLQAAY